MGLILTYDGELYKEPDESYGDETKMVKMISKYDNIIYKDAVDEKLKSDDMAKKHVKK